MVEPGLGVACQSHQDLTANYTFAEIDFVVRRAFLRSTQEEDWLASLFITIGRACAECNESRRQGSRDPVALHHFEKILAALTSTRHAALAIAALVPTEETPPQSFSAFEQGASSRALVSSMRRSAAFA